LEKPLRPSSPDREPHSPHERILDAASAVFAEAGFAGARVDDIATRAGVNKAMLYYHIGDKQALYSAVLMRNFDRVADALADVLEAGGSPRSRLVAVITEITRIVQRFPDHPRMVLREVASGASTLPPEALSRMLEVVDIVAGLLGEGVAAGEFRRTEPVLTHLAIVGMVVFINAISPLRERAAELRPEAGFPDSSTDIGAFLSDLLLEGIAAPGSRAALPRPGQA
jgi:TetR/AcrR family transcriptional regulator